MRLRKKHISIVSVFFILVISFVIAIGFNYINLGDFFKAKIEKTELAKGVSVHFIDVGQGDCELIVDNEKTVLIDGGEKETANKVKNYLNKLNINEINYMIATHPHSDHIGGLAEQIENFKVDNFIMPNIPKNQTPTTKIYENLLNAVNDKHINVIEAKPGLEYNLDKGTLKILGPVKKNYDGLNSYSVAAKYECENKSFLFCGDMEKDAEQDEIKSGQNLKADVLKLNHHGSDTSNTQSFLNAVNPSYCVIEVGKNNKYNLPSSAVLERVKNKTVYRTDENGNVVFQIENGELKIQTSK